MARCITNNIAAKAWNHPADNKPLSHRIDSSSIARKHKLFTTNQTKFFLLIKGQTTQQRSDEAQQVSLNKFLVAAELRIFCQPNRQR